MSYLWGDDEFIVGLSHFMVPARVLVITLEIKGNVVVG
jgi:hypothetical protein